MKSALDHLPFALITEGLTTATCMPYLESSCEDLSAVPRVHLQQPAAKAVTGMRCRIRKSDLCFSCQNGSWPTSNTHHHCKCPALNPEAMRPIAVATPRTDISAMLKELHLISTGSNVFQLLPAVVLPGYHRYCSRCHWSFCGSCIWLFLSLCLLWSLLFCFSCIM